jgi:hypothetical protein
MKHISLFIIGLLLNTNITMGQAYNMKPLSSLINKEDPGWPLVQKWINEGKNKVEILPKDQIKADSALYKTQVTTRSPMGSIIYETGGLLIDNGWIRILGSGNSRLDRSIMDWNKGKSYEKSPERIPFLLIADDVIGGFFAINSGAFGQNDIGKVFYFSPDNLIWESLGISYSDFLVFCFSGDLKKFYKDYHWTGWENDIKTIDGNQAFHIYPYLWTKEGKDINKDSRKPVPVQELWFLYQDIKKQLETKNN